MMVWFFSFLKPLYLNVTKREMAENPYYHQSEKLKWLFKSIMHLSSLSMISQAFL